MMLRVKAHQLFVNKRARRLSDLPHRRFRQVGLPGLQHGPHDAVFELHLLGDPFRDFMESQGLHVSPVEPNPPAPRAEGGRPSASSIVGDANGRMNNCATRIPASTIKSRPEKFFISIFTSPR